MISKKFLKSSFLYTIAGMLPMASATILLPFSLSFLSTSDFGELSVFYILSLLVQVITTYSFDSSLYIHYHEFKNDKTKLASFVSSAFVLMLLIGAVAMIVTLAVGDLAFDLFLENKIAFFPYGVFSVITGVFNSLFKVNSNLLQSRGEPETFLWSNLIFFMLIAGFTIGGLYMFPGTLIGPVNGRMLASILCGLWALARIYKEFGFHFDFALLRSSFGFNQYLFIYQILQWVLNYFDRFIMLAYLTLADVGIYDLAFKCMLVIEFILNGLHNSFYPKVVSTVMAQEKKGSTPELNRYYHGFTSVIMLLLCFSIFFVPYGIQIVVAFGKNKQYLEAIQYLPFVGVIYVFRAMRLYFAAPYSILKYTKPLPYIYLVVTGLKMLLIVLMVGWLEIYGVVLASLISAALEVFLLFVTGRNRFNYKFNVFKIIIAPLCVVLMIMIIEPMNLFAEPGVVHLIYILICGGLLWWVYRNEIKLIKPLQILSGK
jgi:O-antigen/teichoic acid export membrane protein